MAKAYINISIANLEEAKEKAAELVETLSKAVILYGIFCP